MPMALGHWWRGEDLENPVDKGLQSYSYGSEQGRYSRQITPQE